MMSKNTKFIKDIYDDVDLKEVYDQEEKNKNSIFQAIAMILLNFFITEGYVKLSKDEKEKSNKELMLLINTMFISDKNLTNKKTEEILTDVSNKVYKYYSGKELTKKQLKNIVKTSFKGKTFSKRIWNNSNKVSKLLRKDINKFLKGKVSVNDIKNHVDKKFKANRYNIDRLVDTEISRVINDATLLWCGENGIKKVQYVAELDNKTCHDCRDYDGLVFEIDNLPFELPQHSNCRCYFEPYSEI